MHRNSWNTSKALYHNNLMFFRSVEKSPEKTYISYLQTVSQSLHLSRSLVAVLGQLITPPCLGRTSPASSSWSICVETVRVTWSFIFLPSFLPSFFPRPFSFLSPFSLPSFHRKSTHTKTPFFHSQVNKHQPPHNNHVPTHTHTCNISDHAASLSRHEGQVAVLPYPSPGATQSLPRSQNWVSSTRLLGGSFGWAVLLAGCFVRGGVEGAPGRKGGGEEGVGLGRAKGWEVNQDWN